MFFKMCLLELLSILDEYIEEIPFELEYFSRMGKTIDMWGGVKWGFVDASSVLCVLFVARQGRRLGGQSETDRRCPFACEKRTNERTNGQTASKWRRQYVAGRWKYPRLLSIYSPIPSPDFPNNSPL